MSSHNAIVTQFGIVVIFKQCETAHVVTSAGMLVGHPLAYPVCRLVPQQLEPAPATSVDGDGEQCLADEVDQGACGVDREQYVEDLQDRQWLLVQVLQIEQLDPEQFLGGRVVGDQVHVERGLHDPVDGSIVEGDAVEQ